MSRLIWVAAALVLAGIVGFFTWREGVSSNKRAVKHYTLAANAQLVQQYESTLKQISDTSKEAFSLQVHEPTSLEGAMITGRVSPDLSAALFYANDQGSRILEKEEPAAIILAVLFLESQKNDSYRALAEKWKDRTAYPALWFALNSDLLVSEGKKKEAISFLQSNSFTGPQDTPRLTRLALLTEENNTETSQALLEEARQNDPNNPLLSIIAARFLEKANKINEATQLLTRAVNHQEYGRLPKELALADLFKKYGYYSLAISTWNSLGSERPLNVSSEALFWELVAGSTTSADEGKIEPYIQYIKSLSTGNYWNQTAFEKLAGAELFLTFYQETYWLKLLDALAKENNQEALKLIKENPFKIASWNPQLENLLEIALVKQESGQWVNPATVSPSRLDLEYGMIEGSDANDHPLVESLKRVVEGKESLSTENEALLNDNNLISAILLGEGWDRAGLALYRTSTGLGSYPHWYTLELTKTVAKQEGAQAALRFALNVPSFPALALQIAELHLLSGDEAEALKVLETLRTENDEVGARAAWITAQYYLRHRRFDVAHQIISANYYLADTQMGQEALISIVFEETKNQTN